LKERGGCDLCVFRRRGGGKKIRNISVCEGVGKSFITFVKRKIPLIAIKAAATKDEDLYREEY